MPTRVYDGEGVTTYSHRHSARNHTTPGDVERALRERGVFASGGRSSAGRLEIWRQLGNLPPSAFSAPDQIAGNRISDRPLCIRCTDGQNARGKAPRAGLACLRHKRWIGDAQRDLQKFGEALKAERHFRNHLAGRGITFDSFPMLLGREAATTGISPDILCNRKENSGIADPGVLVYPEQVAFARLISRASFLSVVADPQTNDQQRRQRTAREIARITPETHGAEPWRAEERIWTAITNLSRLVQNARLARRPVEDHRYNLLRFASF